MAATNVSGSVVYRTVGTRPIRHDGEDKVTGRAAYGADVALPGMLHGKVLRSPYAHARIVSLDISRALACPEVKAVVTVEDLAAVADRLAELGEDVSTSLTYVRENLLASRNVLYKGHPIAAVAAASPHAAEEALALIDVTYEVLPAVTSVEDAMKPGAPVLHERLARSSLDESLPAGTNVAAHQQYRLGNVAAGFARADLVLERDYRTKTVHQGYIEPQNGTAWWGAEGRVTVWCSSQGPFGIRETTATMLGLLVSRVRVIPMEIGGGFGGKLVAYLEPLAALLSKKSGRPVKMTMTRAEVLEATGPTSGAYVKVKMGVSRNGRIQAAQAYLAFEAGAFPGSPIGGAARCMFSPYDIENLLIDAYDVVTNKPKTTAYRAPGAPIGAFAVESLVDEFCEALEMDPVEFRRLNAAQEGTLRADGIAHPRIGMVETLEAVRRHPHYGSPLEGPNRGRGVAFGYWTNGTGPSSAVASVTPDGAVSLVEGSVDIGGTRTAVAQMLAETLGIPVEDVHPQVADTDTIGYTSATGGSSVTFKTGWAAHEAALDIRRQLVERAARIWDASPDQVEYTDGVLRHRSDPELRLTFRQIAGRLNETGGPVVGRANLSPRGAGASFAATLVDVEVDPSTGKTSILRCTAFQDAGRAIHPSYVEGQMQGGTVQGIGWALNEEYFMAEDGRLLNSSLLDYRMPTALDLPMVDTAIIEVPNPTHPYGVRGVGEASIVPPMAAVANAIRRAVGIRFARLPMTPQIVVSALLERDGART